MAHLTPEEIFAESDISEILAWSEHVRYHDVDVSDSGYIITYLDPTVYTAWLIYSHQADIGADYVAKLMSWGYRVCYLTQASDYPGCEPLRQSITMAHTHDLFTETQFTHRLIL